MLFPAWVHPSLYSLPAAVQQGTPWHTHLDHPRTPDSIQPGHARPDAVAAGTAAAIGPWSCSASSGLSTGRRNRCSRSRSRTWRLYCRWNAGSPAVGRCTVLLCRCRSIRLGRRTCGSSGVAGVGRSERRGSSWGLELGQSTSRSCCLDGTELVGLRSSSDRSSRDSCSHFDLLRLATVDAVPSLRWHYLHSNLRACCSRLPVTRHPLLIQISGGHPCGVKLNEPVRAYEARLVLYVP